MEIFLNDADEIAKILSQNSDKHFVKRITNPGIFPVVSNPDGSISTHRMAAERSEERIPMAGALDWYAFPTLVQTPGGGFRQFENNYDAMRYNIGTNNAIRFDNGDEAQNFARRYKVFWGME